VRGRGVFVDDEKGSSGVRCDVRLIVGPQGQAKKLPQSLAMQYVVRCANGKNCRSNPDSDHRGLGQLNKI
jgi:hypothetical protein